MFNNSNGIYLLRKSRNVCYNKWIIITFQNTDFHLNLLYDHYNKTNGMDIVSEIDCKRVILGCMAKFWNTIKWLQMKTMIRHTFIFSAIVWIALTLITGSQSIILNRHFRQVQNRRITNNILDSYRFISIFRCVSFCLSHLDCIAINYGQDECELLSTGSYENIVSGGWIILC